MFQRQVRRGNFQSATWFLEVLYHSIVRGIRGGGGNAIYGLVMTILQTCMLVIATLIITSLIGPLRRSLIRGDIVLFLLTGVFLFMTHIKTVKSVSGAAGAVSSMMQHEPMTTSVAVLAAAFSTLYTQIVAMGVVLALYHVLWQPVVIEEPIATAGMFFAAWFSGFCIGYAFYAATPWAPKPIGMLSGLYRRANMVLSGKMFLANSLPTAVLPYFDWNPLFHTIDQARGYAFINYFPRYTSPTYPIIVGLIIFVLAMMAEFVTRRAASASWGTARW